VVNQLSELESARLKLVKAARTTDPELARALHQVARIGAKTLGVERVGIWAIESDWTLLRCTLAFDARTEQYSSGMVLRLSEFPAYARALKERRVIAAEDAAKDPRTCELGASYLSVHGVTGLLDCPVYEDGEVVAIVCHERAGRIGPWGKRDQDFAASVADVVGTLFTQVASIRFESELRLAREELAKARVMDSLGRMAAGIAHDFNNVLSGIKLALHVLDQALPPGAREHESAADALELTARGARLVRQLLTFARQGAYAGTPVEAERWLGETLPKLARTLGPDIALEIRLESGPALVALDPSVFEQVVVNLINNARDAMPGGGRVTIHAWRDGQLLRISVSDEGLGMDLATRQQIFEPFFTTKRQGGTGLGLAIVFGAVRSVGGKITVDSEVGRGSTFIVDLPILMSGTQEGSAPVPR
jgi:signal transduction histidine kinase